MDLRQTIRERGLKQRWIAHQIGLSDSLFSNILSGLAVLPDDKVGELAKLLHLTPAEVLHRLPDAP